MIEQNTSITIQEDEMVEENNRISLLRRKLDLKLKDFEIIQLIGNGSQGNVYTAKSPYFQQKVAIKRIKLPKSVFRAQKILKRIESQIVLNTQISNQQNQNLKNFLKFQGYFEEDKHFYLIFQLCQKNAVQEYKNIKTYDQKYVFCFVFLHDIIKSLVLFQRKQIIHRDIKPENILINNNYFKLADFGVARQGFNQKRLTIDVGNIFSKSPEVYMGQYNVKSDVWSLE